MAVVVRSYRAEKQAVARGFYQTNTINRWLDRARGGLTRWGWGVALLIFAACSESHGSDATDSAMPSDSGIDLGGNAFTRTGASGSGSAASAGGSGRAGASGRSTARAGSGGASGSSGGSGGSSTQAGCSGASCDAGQPVVTDAPCTRLFTSADSLSTISSAINSASGGSVICLARANSWSGTLNITGSKSTNTSRVIVCAASAADNACATGGGANPRINGKGGAISFGASAQGLVFQNIDVDCESGCEESGIALGGAKNIRFEGGVYTGWAWGFICNPFSTGAPCDNIEIGILGNLAEIHGCKKGGFFGWLSNSSVRINAHDNGDGTVFTHHFYLSSGPKETPSSNVLFEGGSYKRSSVNAQGVAEGTFLNISGQNKNIAVRNNLFEDSACGTYMIDIGSGGETPVEYCDGLEVSDNEFRGDCPAAISLQMTQRARIFNNLFVVNSTGRDENISIFTSGNDPEEKPLSDIWFFNNTVYCAANCGTNNLFTFAGNDSRFFNNLIYYKPAGVNLIDGCSYFGGNNGPNFNNNFLYAPQSSPRFPACSGGSGNSGVFNRDPGFTAPSSDDFHISASSPAAKFGAAVNAPATDFDGVTRPVPPSAGALDIH